MATIEHLVFRVAADGVTRAEVCTLRVQADSAAAHRLARANGINNYDLVKRVIFESGKYNDIGVNCVRDFATQERMRCAAAVRAEAAKNEYRAQRNAGLVKHGRFHA